VTTSTAASEPLNTRELTALSTRFLTAVRRAEPTASIERKLAGLDVAALERLAADPMAATTVWCNLYNGFTQLLLDRDRSLYASRRRFFSQRLIPVAGHRLSLDEIEHGILRGRQWKLGGGYLRWPWYRSVIQQLCLPSADRDYRIHFALNCGAASCPPILAYDIDTIDEQLSVATRSYLDGAVAYNAARNRATVPRLCLWFRGDFGGASGIQTLLDRFEQVPPGAAPRLRYAPYDWSLSTREFGAAGSEDPATF